MDIGFQHLIIDVELSSHCNASCFFCPREHMPFESHMAADTYQQVLARIHELPVRPRLVFCGTGDATLHPDLVGCVAAAARSGLQPELTTNGLLLTPALAEALVAAGLHRLNISIAAQGKMYQRIYGHSFEAILESVLYCARQAGDRCAVEVSVIRDLFSDELFQSIKAFWQGHGIPLLVMDYTNRAGLLEKPSLPFAYTESDANLCGTPFKSIHIGSDGRFYLCSHDFARRVSFGHVSDTRITESLRQKLQWFTAGCNHDICGHCNQHPLNHRKRPSPALLHSARLIITDMLRTDE